MTRRPQGCRKGETMGKRGDFTLPGEAGFEQLTLKMAEKWGADVIRDSDGTKLSEDITKAGYGIYSTICVIRSDNAWAKENRPANNAKITNKDKKRFIPGSLRSKKMPETSCCSIQ